MANFKILRKRSIPGYGWKKLTFESNLGIAKHGFLSGRQQELLEIAVGCIPQQLLTTLQQVRLKFDTAADDLLDIELEKPTLQNNNVRNFKVLPFDMNIRLRK